MGKNGDGSERVRALGVWGKTFGSEEQDIS